MTTDLFFETIETQYAKKLPFVVYSNPNHSIIKCWLQNDNQLHNTLSFTESGFVFTPFDLNKPAILLPSHKCKHYAIEAVELPIEESEIAKTNDNSESKLEHLALVKKGIETIKKGALKKVVLSRCKIQNSNGINPITIFKHLYTRYKNAMVYCWYHPKVGLWLGATPELLFKMQGQQLTTISLAGTQPYEAEKEAQWSPKEVEEQQIVTDFLEHQIEPFTTNTQIFETETVKAGHLWHLKTRLLSRLKSNSSLKSIIEALHPTPAVCGFPKEKAKNFILNNENYKREFYTGFFGELNLLHTKARNKNKLNVENNAYASIKKQSIFYVNLRCMQIKSQHAIVYVGGGITKDSIPEKEWEETVNKAKTILDVL